MTLEARILEHRDLYRSDSYIDRLVSRHPPTTLDLNTGQLQEEPAAAIGMTVSGRLLRYVGHPDGMGSDFPWSRALAKLRYRCRREHPFHRSADRPYWRGSLCHQLVTFTVIRGFTIENAARILRYDNPEPVLRNALGYIEDCLDEFRQRAEKRAREDEGKFTIYDRPPHHHAPSEAHVAECPNPECIARRAA